MQHVIRIKDKYYILAQSSLAEEKTRVLKSEDMFAVFKHNGDIGVFGLEEHGIYFKGTRFLSRLILHVDNRHPLLLSSIVKENNHLMVVDTTNPDISPEGKPFINKGDLHFHRSIYLKKQVFYERLQITNYGIKTAEFEFSYEFDADYHDIFEVRGLKRKRRGKAFRPRSDSQQLQFSYQGLDRIIRKTTIQFTPKPSQIKPNFIKFRMKLKPDESKNVCLKITCSSTEDSVPISKQWAVHFNGHNGNHCHVQGCNIETTSNQFNNWVHRSKADLLMMLTCTRKGIYPYAGIPWFNTVFGRDGLITALQTLWIYPEIAKGVLSYLSAFQAKKLMPEKDAEPGKILHETRSGEMANLEEIPFGLYYGSVDSTPLYLILAGRYYQQTGDIYFIRRIWPSLKLALQWIDEYGDYDKDGFVEYKSKAVGGGLSQQGWKDSEDSVFHVNGKMAELPIALCEVQGYVYEAKIQMAGLAQAMGNYTLCGDLINEAEALKKRFQSAFWCKEKKVYAIALDGKKRPCTVLTSNAGHTLFSGIVAPEHAELICKQLTGREMFSGWGIRTVGSSENKYNPMSYHNGSIWPHDNAIIASGFDRYGFKAGVLKILTALFDASFFMDLNRLPELFCGFERRKGEGPTLYPVACNPQAWASGAIFMLIQACLGLSIDGKHQVIYFNKPVLPPYIHELRILNLKVGKGRLNVDVRYHKDDVGIRIYERHGEVEVITRK